MEDEIEEYLQIHYILNIEVKFKEFRNYLVLVKFDQFIAEVNFTYDNHFTFDANMNSLTKFIDQCILKYFKKEGV